MTTKILVNTIGITMLVQFLIGFSGTATTDMWDITIGFVLIIAAVWAMIKVNKE